MIYIWLGVVALALIVEFVTMEIVSIWFSVGGLVALILSACGVRFEIQIISFVLVSIACILGLRRITLKYLSKNKEKTNTDLLIGSSERLLSSITSDEAGSVKINGVVWSAITEDKSEINEGEVVEVVKIDGNKLVVKNKENK